MTQANTQPTDLQSMYDLPVKPQLPEHWGFTRKSWPLRYSLWLTTHVEWFEYLTYDEGSYQPGQLTIVYESLSSLKTMLIKIAL